MNRKNLRTTYCLIIALIFLMSVLGNTAICINRNTREFYFDSHYSRETWQTNANYMNDSNPDTYASTTEEGDSQLLNSNTCDGTGPGTIDAVEIRARGYWDPIGNDRDIILRPVFGGSLDGDDHIFNANNSTDWSPWFDITDDTNSHSYWTWSHVQSLDCDVVVGSGSQGSFTLYCSRVEIRVTYT
jgi:hypothetical protein